MPGPRTKDEALAWIQAAMEAGRYIAAFHVTVERGPERGISMDDVRMAISHAEGIEPHDGEPRHDGTCWRVFGPGEAEKRTIGVGHRGVSRQATTSSSALYCHREEEWVEHGTGEDIMDIRCNCGGTFRATTLKNFDMGKLVGLPRLALPWVPGLRCDACGHETVPGELIEFTRDMLAAEIVAQRETRLSPELAAYLRRYLGWTQNELAEKMRIARGTVADWERGEDEISPQHDFILRTLVFAKVTRRLRDSFSAERAASFFETAIASLDTVHAGPPGKMPPAHVIAARLEELRQLQDGQ